ncbi:ExeA family protein [Undibacterium sp. Di26W]|uniref:ExeA family protein n=1 Tax=Undibacterium sp. Di26W TaxID=3413035 RepID=UPI003BEFC80D
MYRSHFGLNESPFSITPNPAFFYSGSQRGDILQALIYAITHGEGIIKVTGEVGSGKTMLCRMLEGMLQANVEVIFLANPTLNRAEVVYVIAGELEINTSNKRPDEVIRLLHAELIGKHIKGKQVVLLVEEAQAMSLETLEEIRLFSNLETSHHKLLQIVLFGQPELDAHLNLPRMRQLKERITHSFKIPPLLPNTIPKFLMFRMRAAGYRGPDIFDKSAIKLLSQVSEGIVRRINILADKSLLAAFADNAHLVQAKHVKEAILDSEFSVKKTSKSQPKWSLVLLLAVAIVIAADLAWRIYWQNRGAPATTQVGTTAVATTTSTAPASPAQMASEQPGQTSPVAIDQNAAPVSVPANTTATAATAATSVSEKLPEPSVESAPVPPQKSLADKDKSDKSASSNVEPEPTTVAKKQAVPGIFQQLADRSKNWLIDMQQDQYTVQIALIDASSYTKIEQFLQKAKAETGIDKLHLYPTRINGIPHFGIVYSSFGSREEARQVNVELEQKWNYRGQLRTVGGLRAEILRSHGQDLWPR